MPLAGYVVDRNSPRGRYTRGRFYPLPRRRVWIGRLSCRGFRARDSRPNGKGADECRNRVGRVDYERRKRQ